VSSRCIHIVERLQSDAAECVELSSVS